MLWIQVFALATLFVDDTSANRSKYDPTPMLLEIESSIGTLTFTNDSCVNDVAFPDPDDT